jgi:intracellular septation protein
MNKLFFDLLPLIAFFAAYQGAQGSSLTETLAPWFGTEAQRVPILLATAVTIVATGFQILWLKITHRPVDRMVWITFGLVVLLGGATLLFHDPRFIQWKPTAVYWTLGLGLWLARLTGRNLVELALRQQVVLSTAYWQRLSDLWTLFFVAMGALNLWVAYSFSEAVWVQFKMFGTLALTLLFVIGQAVWLSRHEKHPETFDQNGQPPTQGA